MLLAEAVQSDWWDKGATIATVLLAAFTWRLAHATVALAKDTKESSRCQIEGAREVSSKQIEAWQRHTMQQIGVQTWLALEARFDSAQIIEARRILARQMPYNEKSHASMSEAVFDFFESVGTAYNNGYLDHKLAVSSFGYYAAFWWEAGKSYVDQERRNLGGDKTIFEEFEKFAKEMSKQCYPIDAKGLHQFLYGERHLESVGESKILPPNEPRSIP